MKLSLLLFLVLFLSGCTSAPKKRTDKLSILQGITSVKEVEFSILAPVNKVLTFELRSAEGEIIEPDEVKTVTRPFSEWAIHKVVFVRDQLKEFNLYVYENKIIIDQRLIGKGQLNQSRLNLAVLSCTNDGFEQNFKIWNVLASKNPEYILMLGDNVYANREPNGSSLSSTPENIWRRYTDVRLTLPFYFQEKLIPVHAVWDDNDYGPKDANESFEYKEASKDIFEAFYAQSLSDEIYSKGFGVGGLLSLGDFNLYFLDARYFRSPNKEGKHLGTEQYKWLMKSLKDESQPSFIIKGDQFFGGYHEYDSYEGKHPQDFSLFVSDLRALGTPFIFLSGDRHLSEIMQFPRSLFGLPSFEITSSPMHGRVFEDSGVKNPWRVVHIQNKVNFTLINNLAQDNHWFMDVENIGEEGEVYYRRELAVFIKDLQNNLNEVRKRRHGKRRYRKSRGKSRRK
jgi:alkaline phosphatase D